MSDYNPNPLNVILITVDSLSAADMSLYGYQRDTTPRISNFSKKCYVFDSMYANGNSSFPGTFSTLTGKYPTKYNLKNFFSFFLGLIKRETISSILKKKGYQVMMVIAMKNFGIWMVDNRWSLSPTRECRLPFSSEANISNTDYSLDATLKKAFDLLESAEAPFFSWIHIYPPHAPYLPSERFRGRFLWEKTFNDYNSQKPYIRRFYSKEVQSVIDKLRCRYNEQILDVDYKIGEFIELLEREGFNRNSIIIISADHGESFEKGYQGHCGPYLYNPIIRIPLIIHLPDHNDRKLIRVNAEQVDIAPTILDILGFDIPQWMDGKSLRQAMESRTIIYKPIFSMNSRFNKKNGKSEMSAAAVIHEGHKLIYYPEHNRSELYNLCADPAELHDISVTENNRTIFLKNLIKATIL